MEPTHDFDEVKRIQLTELARLGREVEHFFNSDSVKMARQMVSGQLYENWVSSVSVAERESIHAEQRAMERVFDALRDIHQEGIVAQHALERLNAASASLAGGDEALD